MYLSAPGPQGKSELCVQRADWTSDHCHCDCNGDHAIASLGHQHRFSGKVGHCTEEIEGQCLVDVLVFLPIAEQENPQC